MAPIGMKTYTEELGYFKAVVDIINNGVRQENRTGVDTYVIYNVNFAYNLSDMTIPLFTHKPTFWRGIVEELLWFLRGETDSKTLEAKGVNIWKGNTNREFLDKKGLAHYREGDVGPMYGYNWRHFGAEYKGCDADYTGQGVDQIARMIDQIKNKPGARDTILESHNPMNVTQGVLTACHQKFVVNVCDGKLIGHLTQRSADMGLGVPFNVASYSLLLHMLAKQTGYEAGMLLHTCINCHVYANHVEPLLQAIDERNIQEPPKLVIEREEPVGDLADYLYEDFGLKRPDGYVKPKKLILDFVA